MRNKLFAAAAFATFILSAPGLVMAQSSTAHPAMSGHQTAKPAMKHTHVKTAPASTAYQMVPTQQQVWR